MRQWASNLNGRIRRYRVLIWFVVGLAGLDRVVAAQARRWDSYDSQPGRGWISQCRKNRWDILVVGGSPAMYGIDSPALAGVRWHGENLTTAYNLGIPLGTAAEAWLAAEHGSAAPPRLIIYGATATDFNDSRLSTTGPRFLMTLNDLGHASAASPKLAGWLTWNFSSECLARAWQLYYYRRGIRLWLADAADRCWPGACPEQTVEARRGLVLSAKREAGNGLGGGPPATPTTRLDALKAAHQITDFFPYMDDFHVGGTHLASLELLIAWTQRKHVPMLIVDLPVPADLDVRLYPTQFASYRSILAKAAEIHGISVLHATREAVGLNDADFCDLVHLNADGASKLSAWLRAQIGTAGEAAP